MPTQRKKRATESAGDSSKPGKGASVSNSGSTKPTKRRTNTNEKDGTDLPQPSASHRLSARHIIFRFMTILTIVLLIQWYYTPGSVKPLVEVADNVTRRVMPVECSKDFADDIKQFKECAPRRCSRVIMDNHISKGEAKKLLQIAKRGFKYGSPSGGAAILDLHSGALSHGDTFVNLYKFLDNERLQDVFKKEDFELYGTVANKIRIAIAGEFNIPPNKLYLTKPTFFSRMTNKPPKTDHDEYWHVHVDKTTYKTFDYTSLLYLADYDRDFEGGRFVFVDKDANRTVDPKLGRLSFFTSGSENTHHVEKVTRGTRYAITVSFTCDKKHAIQAPKLPVQSDT